jgi:hypothetical protein
MRIAPFILALLILPSILFAQGDTPGTGGSPSRRDLDGRALAAEVVHAVGGDTAWNDPNWNLYFDFVVVRDGKELSRISHEWIRKSNYYTVSGLTKDGKRWRVVFTNIYDRIGSATIDGETAPDSLKSRLLEAGYGRFINDTYWLLMPHKLLDSGVHQRREADTVIDGKRYEVLALTFGNVGLTPGDHYLLFIDPATKLVERWHYHLQSGSEADYKWLDYESLGPIKLALDRMRPDGSAEIRFEHVRVDRIRSN